MNRELSEKDRSIRLVYTLYDNQLGIKNDNILSRDNNLIGFAILPKGTVTKTSYNGLKEVKEWIKNKDGKFVKNER